MVNETFKNASDFKTVTDATAEFGKKAVQTATEVGVRALNDVVAFGDIVAKAQINILNTYVPGNKLEEVYTAMSKAQSEGIKTLSSWADNFKSYVSK
jgi:hypothetical protein